MVLSITRRDGREDEKPCLDGYPTGNIIRVGQPQLFSQALRRMLEQMRPEEVPTLHRRAALWYLEQQAIGAALRHLVAGQFFFEAADPVGGLARARGALADQGARSC
jgi:hypothetical protein